MRQITSKSLLGRLADLVEKKTGAPRPADLKIHRPWQTRPQRSKFARFFRAPSKGDNNSRIEFHNGSQVVVTPRGFRLVRSWPKGHDGKMLRKKWRKLIRQGHHSPLEARKLVMYAYGGR